VKVRIKRTPREHELDGVRLDGLQPGMVRDMPQQLATWLAAEQYADIEMRQSVPTHDDDFSDLRDVRSQATDPTAPRRRARD
jgi:hypothetical protein